MELNGQNILVLDLETRRSATDCRFCQDAQGEHALKQSHGYTPLGWENHAALGLAIGCYWRYADNRLGWFDGPTLAALVQDLVERQPLLVSFNGLGFDFVLMRALLDEQAETLRREAGAVVNEAEALWALSTQFQALFTQSYDLLAEMWKVDAARKFERGLNSLDAIAQANGMDAKALDGATAPRLWAQGRYAEVIAYNVADVLKTKRLFELVCAGEPLRRGDGTSITLPLPAFMPVERRRA